MTAHTIPINLDYVDESRRTITCVPPRGKNVSAGDTFSKPVPLYCGTGGTVVAKDAQGTSVTTIVPSGGYFPCQITEITSVTGAANMMVVY